MITASFNLRLSSFSVIVLIIILLCAAIITNSFASAQRNEIQLPIATGKTELILPNDLDDFIASSSPLTTPDSVFVVESGTNLDAIIFNWTFNDRKLIVRGPDTNIKLVNFTNDVTRSTITFQNCRIGQVDYFDRKVLPVLKAPRLSVSTLHFIGNTFTPFHDPEDFANHLFRLPFLSEDGDDDEIVLEYNTFESNAASENYHTIVLASEIAVDSNFSLDTMNLAGLYRLSFSHNTVMIPSLSNAEVFSMRKFNHDKFQWWLFNNNTITVERAYFTAPAMYIEMVQMDGTSFIGNQGQLTSIIEFNNNNISMIAGRDRYPSWVSLSGGNGGQPTQISAGGGEAGAISVVTNTAYDPGRFRWRNMKHFHINNNHIIYNMSLQVREPFGVQVEVGRAVHSDITNIDSFQINHNQVRVGGAWPLGLRVLLSPIARNVRELTMNNNHIITSCEDPTPDYERNAAGLSMRLWALHDSSLMSMSNNILLIRGTSVNTFEGLRLSSYDYVDDRYSGKEAIDLSIGQWKFLGSRNIDLVECSNNTAGYEKDDEYVRQEFKAISFYHQFMYDIRKIHIADNFFTARINADSIPRGLGNGLAIQNIKFSFLFQIVDEVLIENNTIMCQGEADDIAALDESTTIQQAIYIINERSFLSDNTVLNPIYKNRTNNLTITDASFDVQRFIVRDNRMRIGGISSAFFAALTQCMYFTTRHPLWNLGELLIEKNFCEMQNITRCNSMVGCGAFGISSSVLNSSISRVTLRDNKVSITGSETASVDTIFSLFQTCILILEFSTLLLLPRDLTEIPPRLFTRAGPFSLSFGTIEIKNNTMMTSGASSRLFAGFALGEIEINESLRIENNNIIGTNLRHGFSKRSAVMTVGTIYIETNLKPAELKATGLPVPDALLLFNSVEATMFAAKNTFIFPQSIFISNNYFGLSDEVKDYLINILPTTTIITQQQQAESISSFGSFFIIEGAKNLQEAGSTFVVTIGGNNETSLMWPPEQVVGPATILDPIQPTATDRQLSNHDALFFEQGKFPVDRVDLLQRFGSNNDPQNSIRVDAETGVEYVEVDNWQDEELYSITNGDSSNSIFPVPPTCADLFYSNFSGIFSVNNTFEFIESRSASFIRGDDDGATTPSSSTNDEHHRQKWFSLALTDSALIGSWCSHNDSILLNSSVSLTNFIFYETFVSSTTDETQPPRETLSARPSWILFSKLNLTILFNGPNSVVKSQGQQNRYCIFSESVYPPPSSAKQRVIEDRRINQQIFILDSNFNFSVASDYVKETSILSFPWLRQRPITLDSPLVFIIRSHFEIFTPRDGIRPPSDIIGSPSSPSSPNSETGLFRNSIFLFNVVTNITLNHNDFDFTGGRSILNVPRDENGVQNEPLPAIIPIVSYVGPDNDQTMLARGDYKRELNISNTRIQSNVLQQPDFRALTGNIITAKSTSLAEHLISTVHCFSINNYNLRKYSPTFETMQFLPGPPEDRGNFYQPCPESPTVTHSETISPVPECAPFKAIFDPRSVTDIRNGDVTTNDVIKRKIVTAHFFIIAESDLPTPAPLGSGMKIPEGMDIRRPGIAGRETFTILRASQPNITGDAEGAPRFPDPRNPSRTLPVMIKSETPEVFSVVEASVKSDRVLSVTLNFKVINLNRDTDYNLRMRLHPNLFACFTEGFSDVDVYDYSNNNNGVLNQEILQQQQNNISKWYPVDLFVSRRNSNLPSALLSVASVGGSIALVVTAPMSGSVVGANLARAGALSALAECSFSMEAEVSFIENPLGIGYGNDIGYWRRGSIIGNSIMLTLIFLLLALTAGIRKYAADSRLKRWNKKHADLRRNSDGTYGKKKLHRPHDLSFKNACYLSKIPGVFIVPVAILSYGQIGSAVALLIAGFDANDRILAIFCLGYHIAYFSWAYYVTVVVVGKDPWIEYRPRPTKRKRHSRKFFLDSDEDLGAGSELDPITKAMFHSCPSCSPEIKKLEEAQQQLKNQKKWEKKQQKLISEKRKELLEQIEEKKRRRKEKKQEEENEKLLFGDDTQQDAPLLENVLISADDTSAADLNSSKFGSSNSNDNDDDDNESVLLGSPQGAMMKVSFHPDVATQNKNNNSHRKINNNNNNNRTRLNNNQREDQLNSPSLETLERRYSSSALLLLDTSDLPKRNFLRRRNTTGLLKKTFLSIAAPYGDWRMRKPRDPVVAATTSPDGFLLPKAGDIFEPCQGRTRWYQLFEITVGVTIAIISGAQAGLESCEVAALVMTLVNALPFVVLIPVRPYNDFLTNTFSIFSTIILLSMGLSTTIGDVFTAADGADVTNSLLNSVMGFFGTFRSVFDFSLLMMTFEAWALVPLMFGRHLLMHEIYPGSRLQLWFAARQEKYAERLRRMQSANNKFSERQFDDRTLVRNRSMTELEMLMTDADRKLKERRKSTVGGRDDSPLLLTNKYNNNNNNNNNGGTNNNKKDRRDKLGVVSRPSARKKISEHTWDAGLFEDDPINENNKDGAILSRYKPTSNSHAQSFRFGGHTKNMPITNKNASMTSLHHAFNTSSQGNDSINEHLKKAYSSGFANSDNRNNNNNKSFGDSLSAIPRVESSLVIGAKQTKRRNSDGTIMLVSADASSSPRNKKLEAARPAPISTYSRFPTSSSSPAVSSPQARNFTMTPASSSKIQKPPALVMRDIGSAPSPRINLMDDTSFANLREVSSSSNLAEVGQEMKKMVIGTSSPNSSKKRKSAVAFVAAQEDPNAYLL